MNLPLLLVDSLRAPKTWAWEIDVTPQIKDPYNDEPLFFIIERGTSDSATQERARKAGRVSNFTQKLMNNSEMENPSILGEVSVPDLQDENLANPQDVSSSGQELVAPQTSNDEECSDDYIDGLRRTLSHHYLTHSSTYPPDSIILLRDLAKSLVTRFNRSANLADLNEAISMHQAALAYGLPDDPNRSDSLEGLGVALWKRFAVETNPVDLHQAIVHHRDGLELRPPGHSERSLSLSGLGNALLARFLKGGNMVDLEEALKYQTEGLELRPDGHPMRLASLNNLAEALHTYYVHKGAMKDLEQTIRLLYSALELTPPSHPNRLTVMNNLAKALRHQSKAQGNMELLSESIRLHYQVLDLCLPGHPERPYTLIMLGLALWAQCSDQADLGKLDNAITHYQEAIQLLPPQHTLHVTALGNLANALHTRYTLLGNTADQDNAIECAQGALRGLPVGSTDRVNALNSLASMVLTRFQKEAGRADLGLVIAYLSEAVDLLQPEHTVYVASIRNLGVALSIQFEQQGDEADLSKAIVLLSEALELHPPGTSGRLASLHDLACALWTKDKHCSSISDLETSIKYHKEALQLCPLGNPTRPSCLNSLAHALLSHHIAVGDISGLDKTIILFQEALELCPSGHPRHYPFLSNLSTALLYRSAKSGHMADLEDVLQNLTTALVELQGHVYQYGLLVILAETHWIRNRLNGTSEPQSSDLTEAFRLFEVATEDLAAPLRDRLMAAVLWRKAADTSSHASALRAYSASLDILHKFIVRNPTVNSQLRALGVTSSLVSALASDGAASAVKAGKLRTVVELLEQGRGILWRSMSGYRTSLEKLREVDENLADRFEKVSGELEGLVTLSGEVTSSRVSQEKTAQKYRLLLEKQEGVVEEIQNLPGFSNFLKAITFSALQSAAANGPVIIINISTLHSDGLIVCEGIEEPHLVPLPNATLEVIKALSEDLQYLLQKKLDEVPNLRKRLLVKLLRSLWDLVVHPIVEMLTSLLVPSGSHIWWCPTSSLCSLPLHAAGPWSRGAMNLPDMFISSYTPTLSALIKARASRPASTPDLPNMMTIGVPQPAGDDGSLEYVGEELEQIGKAASLVGLPLTRLEGEAATKDNVLHNIQEHSWVHFACHGHQDISTPFHSSFSLYDHKLTLQDIIKAKLPNAEFAFLSACHAATGDRSKPDEVVHLAAGLQFSGFRSVVGTLWPMVDEDGPAITQNFYEYMFRSGEQKADYQDAAKGLQEAVNTLRSKGVPMERWVNFIHIGA